MICCFVCKGVGADKPYPLSKDAWLSTGDIGRITANNSTSIIHQRKNLFQISSGEYIDFTDRITKNMKSNKQCNINRDATLSNISHNVPKQQQSKYVELVCKIFYLSFCFVVF